MTRSAAYRYSYLISFLYVGFGTLSILSVYPDSLLYGEWVLWFIPTYVAGTLFCATSSDVSPYMGGVFTPSRFR